MENDKKRLIRFVENDSKVDIITKNDLIKVIEESTSEDFDIIKFILSEAIPEFRFSSGGEGAKSRAKTAIAIGVPTAAIVTLYLLFKKYGMPRETIQKIAKMITPEMIRRLQIPSKTTVVGTSIVTVTLFYGAYRNIRALFDKCTRECGVIKLNLPKRQLCMLQCKRQMILRRVKLIRNLLTDCDKVKDPASCKEVLISKLDKAAKDLRKVDDKIVKLKLETVQD